ncbi:MAG: hypothetical protein ACEY3M_01475 [Wolbachia sp.]
MSFAKFKAGTLKWLLRLSRMINFGLSLLAFHAGKCLYQHLLLETQMGQVTNLLNFTIIGKNSSFSCVSLLTGLGIRCMVPECDGED